MRSIRELRTYGWKLSLIGAGLVATAGCTQWAGLKRWTPAASARAPQVRRATQVESPEAMLAAVKKLVPSGTSLAQAEAIMKAEGFDCSFAYDDTTDCDHLRCQRTDPAGALVSWRWTVRLPYRDGMVLEPEVEIAGLGP